MHANLPDIILKKSSLSEEKGVYALNAYKLFHRALRMVYY
jgi:hypothetical protein